jgi:hypothetical protein
MSKGDRRRTDGLREGAVVLKQSFKPMHLILASSDGEAHDSAPRDSDYRDELHHSSFTSLRSSSVVDRLLEPILKQEDLALLGSLGIKVGWEVGGVLAAVPALSAGRRVKCGSFGHTKIVANQGFGFPYVG